MLRNPGVPVIFLMSSVLFACGGGGSESSGAPSSTPVTVAPTPSPTPVVTGTPMPTTTPTPIATPTSSPSTAFDLSGWDLVWNDEFDYPDSQLEDNWISQNGATDPDGFVLCSRWRENAVISDGVLELLAKRETREGQDWTCGNIWTRAQFKYGYFEARFRYAAATGTNNSFWLWPKYGVDDGEKAFELDINEGHYPNEVNTNVHNWTDTFTKPDGSISHPNDQQQTVYPGENFADDFHVFGLNWTESTMDFYVDGELVRSEGNDLNHSYTNILLSLAILKWEIAGRVTNAIDGTSMKVDYVRYYQKNGGNYPPVNTGDSDIPVTGVTIVPGSLILSIGETAFISGRVIPSDATNKGVWFKSSDTEVLTVNSSGEVRAIADGTVTITVYTSEGNYTSQIEAIVGSGVKAAN